MQKSIFRNVTSSTILVYDVKSCYIAYPIVSLITQISWLLILCISPLEKKTFLFLQCQANARSKNYKFLGLRTLPKLP